MNETPPPSQEVAAVVKTASPGTLDYEIQSFEFQQRRAKALSASKLVPEIFQGPNGVPNILIGMEIAHRLNLPVMSVLQSIVVIHGRPAWKASFIVAMINNSGKFQSLRYKSHTLGKKKWNNKEFDDIGYQIVTKDKWGEVIEGPIVTLEMAYKDGWARNDKYATLPEQMLRWRAVTFFASLHCPELLIGLPSADEIDSPKAGRQVSVAPAQDPRRPKLISEEPAAEVESGNAPSIQADWADKAPAKPIDELVS